MEALAIPMVSSLPEPLPEPARPARDGDPEERRLAALLAASDPAAIALVEERYGRVLAGFLREALGDRQAAEEVKQQVLVEVWRRGPDYDLDRASPLTWVMTIARSRAIDERRRRRPDPVDPADVEAGAGAAPDSELDAMLERWRVADLLGRIPAEEAEALRLRFYAELSQSEIAERTGIPLGTVKTRMVRGLSRLRELLAEEAA